jgi:hypothetical protein
VIGSSVDPVIGPREAPAIAFYQLANLRKNAGNWFSIMAIPAIMAILAMGSLTTRLCSPESIYMKC